MLTFQRARIERLESAWIGHIAGYSCAGNLRAAYRTFNSCWHRRSTTADTDNLSYLQIVAAQELPGLAIPGLDVLHGDTVSSRDAAATLIRCDGVCSAGAVFLWLWCDIW